MVRLSPRFSSPCSSLPPRRSFLSASLVAAMRVMEASSGITGSTEAANAICTGPRTWPALMAVPITAPKVRMSKKLAHMKSRRR